MSGKFPAGSSSGPASKHGSPYGNNAWSSSGQSLAPSDAELGDTTRRKLLLIYLHGYMGNDQSFQSFPAHVHSYLKLALVETHVIHSKVYPRYKTYKHIEVARDNFSRWLEPHESPTTDIIIIGHSMGGLLAAEIVLMPPRGYSPPHHKCHFRHRILGTINMDAPLLGLHPGIVVSGISSLFRSDDKPKGESVSPSDAGPSQSSLALTNSSSPTDAGLSPMPSPSPTRPGAISDAFPDRMMTFDPNFNPSFANDIRLQDRGWWQNVVHFVKKHNSEGLIDATTKHFISHLEFGGTLFDFQCLKARYHSIRDLEDIDDLQTRELPNVPKQVRFAQYYTVCHGFPKTPKAPPANADQRPGTAGSGQSSTSPGATTREAIQTIQDDTSPGEPGLNAIAKEEAPADEGAQDEEDPVMTHVEPAPIEEPPSPDAATAPPPPYTEFPSSLENTVSQEPRDEPVSNMEAQASESPVAQQDAAEDLAAAVATMDMDLPVIPDEPEKPELPNLDDCPDKASRQAAEKEAKIAQKSYDQAVKTRDKAIKEREKLISKKEKKVAQEEKKQAQLEKKQAHEEEKKKKAEEKKLAQEEEKQRKAEEKQRHARAKSNAAENAEAASALVDELTAQAAAQSSPFHATSGNSSDDGQESTRPKSKSKGSDKKGKAPKGKKERKFCNLPSKINGQIDPKWIKVFMGDVDEVGAHTGLFFPGEHYERLVGDVGHLIVQWVHEDASKRAVLEME